jgi:hypothetical protein
MARENSWQCGLPTLTLQSSLLELHLKAKNTTQKKNNSA